MQLRRLRVAVAARRPLGLPTARLRAAGRLTELGPADLAFGVEECGELMLRRTGRRAPSDRWKRCGRRPRDGRSGSLSRPARAGRPRPGRRGPDALDAYLAEELLDPMEPRLRDATDRFQRRARARSTPGARARTARATSWRRYAGEASRCARRPRTKGGSHTTRSCASCSPRGSLANARRRGNRNCTRSSRRRWRPRTEGPRGSSTGWRPASTTARAQLVAIHGEALLATAPATVGRWLEQLPEDARSAPGLRLLEGRLTAAAGRLEDAEAPLRDAVDGYARAGDDEQAWSARAVLADTYLVSQRFEAAVRLADGYASSSAVAAPMVALMAAAALGGAGAYREASALFADAAAAVQPAVRWRRWCRACTGSSWTSVRAARRRARRCARDDRAARARRSVRLAATSAGHGRSHPRRPRASRLTRSSASSAPSGVAERTALGGYVTHFGHLFRASLHARAGRLADAELALSRPRVDCPGGIAGDAEVTRATIAAGRGDYDALEQAIESAARVPWNRAPTCHRPAD